MEAVYSDRLFEWDSCKYERYCNKVFGKVIKNFDKKHYKDIETFLSNYFNKKIKLLIIMKGCNVSTGIPFYVFYYQDYSKIEIIYNGNDELQKIIKNKI